MEVDFETGKINVRPDLIYEFKELVTRKEMAAIRAALDALEGGKAPEVIDVESDG